MSSESNLAVDTDENHTENITRNDFLTEWEAIEDRAPAAQFLAKAPVLGGLCAGFVIMYVTGMLVG